MDIAIQNPDMQYARYLDESSIRLSGIQMVIVKVAKLITYCKLFSFN